MRPVEAIPASQLRSGTRPDFMPQMVITAQEYEARTNDLRQFVREQLVEGVDYGCIPNTPKATLFKPGAEKLLAVFGFATRFETTHRVETLCADKPFCLYEVRVLVVSKKTGAVEAEGLGSCNSKEKKYANKFAAEIANTVLKMAKKRALIDATVLATRTGALFSSNDLEETSNSTPVPALEPLPQPAPELSLVASRLELDFAENMRARAVALGYLTKAGTKPKPIAEGERRSVVKAKAQKWQKFVKEHELAARVPAEPESNGEGASQGKGPRYTIPTYARSTNCTSCGAEIFWTHTKDKAKVPVNSDGFSHFTTCPNASAHSKKNAGKAAAQGDKPGLPGHIKHLWAVADANKLDTKTKTKALRDERLLNGNAVLLDHNLDPVESWNDLSVEAARCLSGAIDVKILTWGFPVEGEPVEAEVAA